MLPPVFSVGESSKSTLFPISKFVFGKCLKNSLGLAKYSINVSKSGRAQASTGRRKKKIVFPPLLAIYFTFRSINCEHTNARTSHLYELLFHACKCNYKYKWRYLAFEWRLGGCFHARPRVLLAADHVESISKGVLPFGGRNIRGIFRNFDLKNYNA